MASGRLGAFDLAATTNTTLYTVTVGKVASCSVNFCNRNATPVTIRLAMSSTGTPSSSEWLIYDYVIDGNGSLEKTGIVLDATKNIVGYSSAANVTALVYGYEE